MPDPSTVCALILDCDGVMTDGSLYVDDSGLETRRFSVRDGFGIALWKSFDLHIAVISGRGGDSLRHRMSRLGVEHIVQSSADKAAALRDAAAHMNLTPAQCAFMGDDWPDLPAMALAGYPIAVADAAQAVRSAAAWVTTTPGGHGAVREAVEHILAAKGLLEGGPAMFGGVRARTTDAG